jgi:hypothetical protein
LLFAVLLRRESDLSPLPGRGVQKKTAKIAVLTREPASVPAIIAEKQFDCQAVVRIELPGLWPRLVSDGVPDRAACEAAGHRESVEEQRKRCDERC